MRLLDSIAVRHQGVERSVQLFAGDLTRIPADEAVDLLIVSAFPGSYYPTKTSLMGALHRAGVSVEALSQDKEVDLRQFSHCWLSRPVTREGMNFRRVLCFEPTFRGSACEVVGDIFRSIVPFTGREAGITSLAMPLVSTGHFGEPAAAMLEALTDAAVHWLSAGLALDRIKIVVQEPAGAAWLGEVFGRVKARHQTPAVPPPRRFKYDVFVSYSQKDKVAVDGLLAALSAARPGLRVFMDRLELKPGAAWQQHIFEALDDSRRVISAFSPNYLASKICLDEFNMAVLRHREEGGVLLPVYVYSAQLPTYMKLIQYEDVREFDATKLPAAATALARMLDSDQV